MNKRFLIFLIVTVALAFLLAKHDVAVAGNETSRYCAVESVLERGTFVIDDSIFVTPDKGKRNGHYYGDKPPLLTFAAIGFGRLLKCFGIRYLPGEYHTAVYLTNVVVFILSWLTGWFFYVGLRRRKRMPEGYRIAMSVLSVVSTLVLTYSATLNNHTLCAAAMMGLILLLETCETDGLTPRRAFLAGILTGLLFNLEFVTGGVMGVTVFVFVVKSASPERLRNTLLYAAAGGLMIALEGAMNMISYGSPLPLYLSTHKPSFVEKNYLYYAFNILFGFEGFFLYMPALLFAGFACASKRMLRDRVFVYMMAATAGAMFLFAVGTSDFGGWCYGYRFLIPFAPVLLYYAAIYFGRPRPRLKRWVLFRLALFWGVVFALVGLTNPWNIGYEGSSSPKNTLPEHFKNGFLANTFVCCWKYAPDSAITQLFMDRIYRRDYALMYLVMELENRRDHKAFHRLQGELREIMGAELDSEAGAGLPADDSAPAGEEEAPQDSAQETAQESAFPGGPESTGD